MSLGSIGSPRSQLLFLKGRHLLSYYAAPALEAAPGPCRTGEQRLLRRTGTELLVRTLQWLHEHLLCHGRLFELGLKAKALYNYQEIPNPAGLQCACLPLDCLQGSAKLDCAKVWPDTRGRLVEL